MERCHGIDRCPIPVKKNNKVIWSRARNKIWKDFSSPEGRFQCRKEALLPKPNSIASGEGSGSGPSLGLTDGRPPDGRLKQAPYCWSCPLFSIRRWMLIRFLQSPYCGRPDVGFFGFSIMFLAVSFCSGSNGPLPGFILWSRSRFLIHYSCEHGRNPSSSQFVT